MALQIPSKNYRGLILDFDGTLVDSMMVHQRAWKKAIEKVGGKFPLSHEEYFNLGGTSTRDVAALFLQKNNLSHSPDEIVHHKESFFHESLDEITPIVPVLEYVLEQKSNDVQLSIASGSSYSIIDAVLRKLKLESHFPHILTPKDVKRSKPAPDLFLLAAERMNLPASDCLVFEDSPLGIQAAEAAGMDWVLVPKSLWKI